MTLTEPAPLAPATGQSMLDLLRRHYLPEGRTVGGIFAPEINSPDGSRRADLIWAPTTIAGGTGLVGHEIKVSRADLQAELGDPAKADPWAQYCQRWWLVVSDPALITGLDVPAAWGVMAPPSGRRTRAMSILRPAPKLTPLSAGPAWRRIAAWQLYLHENHRERLGRENSQLQQSLDAHRRRGELAGLQVQYRDDPRAVQLQSILRKLDTASQHAHRWRDLPEDVVVAALLDLAAISDTISDTRHLLGRLLRDVAALTSQSALTQLQQHLSTAITSTDTLQQALSTAPAGPAGDLVDTGEGATP